MAGRLYSVVRYLHICNKSSILHESAFILGNLQVRHAGHAKWQNIAHTKGANDLARSKLFSKFALQMKSAIREGGPSVVSNTKLANIIEHAKKGNMPKASIQKVLDRALTANKDGKSFVLEFRSGITQACIKVDCMTDSPKRSKNLVMGAVKKFGYEETKVGMFFNEVGLITAKNKANGKTLTLDDAEEFAIEAGAEDVEIDEDGEFKFNCSGSTLRSVEKSLRDQGLDITASEIIHEPTNTVELDDKAMQVYTKMMAKLEEIEDVNEIYNNISNI